MKDSELFGKPKRSCPNMCQENKVTNVIKEDQSFVTSQEFAVGEQDIVNLTTTHSNGVVDETESRSKLTVESDGSTSWITEHSLSRLHKANVRRHENIGHDFHRARRNVLRPLRTRWKRMNTFSSMIENGYTTPVWTKCCHDVSQSERQKKRLSFRIIFHKL